MPKYIYTARDEKGRAVKGKLTANDGRELSERIHKLGYYLTGFKIIQESSSKTSTVRKVRMKRQEVYQFTYQLATLLDAGLPLLESLKSLSREADSERVKLITDYLSYRVESGESFKEALSFHPATFSKLYISIVGAGETTGNLSQVLSNLALLLEWQRDLRAKIGEATIYPIILSFVMVGVVFLLVGLVIPKFKPIFEQLGGELPLPTMILLNVSGFIQHGWWVILIAVFLLFFGYRFYNSTPGGRYKIDSVKLKLPIFGLLLREITLSRFAHTFSMCFEAGIDILTTLDIAKETCGNARIEKAVSSTRDSVNVGEKLALSLQITDEFPPMMVRMIGVGEQSGTLAKTLTKVSDFYDKEVTAVVKRIFVIFEPVMIVLMGVVVGGIALSIFLPMFRLAQMIGG